MLWIIRVVVDELLDRQTGLSAFMLSKQGLEPVGGEENVAGLLDIL